ncbi:MAG: GTP-binding protein [Helicobacteraceae bacterium]|jgi:small GTP-binding protein|nr:GTP-binding protein [Helicobacteraceae bacterium]
MIQKKICLLGAFSVGKTSLVSQFVHSVFSDRYLSTIGVKISKKEMTIDNNQMTMVIWDLEGKDVYTDVKVSYLRGASGFFIVADGTRKETFDDAMGIHKLAIGAIGNEVPCYLLLNKSDLTQKWEITDDMITDAMKKGVKAFMTSARTGHSVAEAFEALARDMMSGETK